MSAPRHTSTCLTVSALHFLPSSTVQCVLWVRDRQKQYYLNTQDAKDDEEGTANEDNVPNGLEG